MAARAALARHAVQAEPPGHEIDQTTPATIASRKWPVRRIATKPTPAASQPGRAGADDHGSHQGREHRTRQMLQPRAHERTR